ncbi:hypothetical protein JHK82_014045 [Glycine max]|nr:hypothetical protein JHK82_014045 [Glycine max]
MNSLTNITPPPLFSLSQYCNMSAEAIIGRLKLKGLLKKVLVLASGSKKFNKWMIWLRESNLWLSSFTCALKTEFSASTAKYLWLVRFTDVRSC